MNTSSTHALIRLITMLVFMAVAALLSTEALMLLRNKIPLPILLKRLFRFKLIRQILHTSSILVVCLYTYATFIEPKWLDISMHTITTDKLQNTSIRIVQVTDTHCDKREVLESRLGREIAKLKPDIIVFTGDAINEPKIEYQQRFHDLFKAIDAPLGKFGCKGNWPYDTEFLFRNATIEPLFNRSVRIEKGGESIELCGINFNQSDLKNLAKLSQADSHIFRILLSHGPDWIESLPYGKVDLYLAGHTHGGQIAIPGFGAIITYSRFGKKYEAGMYKVRDTTMYISRGVGLDGGGVIKARFFARPELAVFNIVPKP